MMRANWPAPPCIKTYTTLRSSEFKLGERSQLKDILDLPSEPIWLNQIHGTTAVPALIANQDKEADASFTDQPRQVCVVITADCLPILLCHRQGTHVAAIHGGWRGLVNGIIENTLDALALPPEEILVWFGP